MRPDNIGIGLVMTCGTVAASIGLFAQRFKEGWFWRGTTAPMSFRSRFLACVWMASWTITAFTDFASAIIIVPIAATVFLVWSYSTDRRKHDGDT
jgi:hypothetical protein